MEAALKETPLERMKVTIKNLFLIKHFLILLKPFNPILGETY